MKKFKIIAVGGTFDELHKGHKTLLFKAFEIGEKVVIGLSSDDFVSKMSKPHKTASYEERQRELEIFLEESGVESRAEIVPLDDPVGRTMSIKGLEALVVSKETEKIAQAINVKRENSSLPPLKIVAVDMVPAQNNVPISTTRIRSGEIDRNGCILQSQKKV